MRVLSALLLVALQTGPAPVRPHFSMSPELATCADHYYNFEFSLAVACTRDAYRRHPESLEVMVWHSRVLWVSELDRHVDVNQSLLALVLEKEPIRQVVDATVRQEFLTIVNRATTLARSRSSDDTNRYYLGEIYGNETAWNLLLEGRKREAMSGVKRTMQQMEGLVARDPSIAEPYALLGMGNYLLATNPWYMRAIAFFFGASGDKPEALRQLRLASDAEIEDARFLYKSVLIREGRIPEAIDLVNKLLQRYRRNVFFVIELGDMLARVGRVDEARSEYERASRLIAERPELRTRFMPGFIEGKLNGLLSKPRL
jgi:tetratricopeptide (TPR) repeat protein